jgi:hypothetical protein
MTRQVWAKKASESKPPMKRRKIMGGIKTGESLRPRDQPGGCLLTGQAVPGVEVARAWLGLLCGTCEPVVPRPRAASGAVSAHGRSLKRDPQAAEIVRGRVAMRGTGADRLVVAMRPGNAGGAKGTGRPGSFGGQPPFGRDEPDERAKAEGRLDDGSPVSREAHAGFCERRGGEIPPGDSPDSARLQCDAVALAVAS